MEDEQKEAYLYGAEMAGEYLREIGKSDLAALSPAQVLTFSECMCKNYHMKFIELTNKSNFC